MAGPKRPEGRVALPAVAAGALGALAITETGALPRVLPGAEPDGERILNWRQLYDLSELPDIPEDSPLFAQVTSTAENCLGGECPFWSECFVVQARQRAQSADLVVVNHHLLLADLESTHWLGSVLAIGIAFGFALVTAALLANPFAGGGSRLAFYGLCSCRRSRPSGATPKALVMSP